MSKSLKNFITIDDALEKYSARQLRFAFLLQNWNARLDFKEDSMREVRNAEGNLNVSCLLLFADLVASRESRSRRLLSCAVELFRARQSSCRRSQGELGRFGRQTSLRKR